MIEMMIVLLATEISFFSLKPLMNQKKLKAIPVRRNKSIPRN